jgi:hypothetical protein
MDQHPDQPADDGAVDADELQVAPDRELDALRHLLARPFRELLLDEPAGLAAVLADQRHAAALDRLVDPVAQSGLLDQGAAELLDPGLDLAQQRRLLLAEVVQQPVPEPVPQPDQQLLHLGVVHQLDLVAPDLLGPLRVGFQPQREFGDPAVEHALEAVGRIAPDRVELLAQRGDRTRLVGVDRHLHHRVLYAQAVDQELADGRQLVGIAQVGASPVEQGIDEFLVPAFLHESVHYLAGSARQVDLIEAVAGCRAHRVPDLLVVERFEQAPGGARGRAAQRCGIRGVERRQVQAMFEEERAHLKALPLLGMQYFTQAVRTVCDDSCVRVEHCSYAARPAAISSKVLDRLFAQRIEIRDLASGALLRTHAKAERPGTVVLPQDERVFNHSRETRLILRQAAEIGPQASRVGQRKLWGIVGLARRYPAHCVEAACGQALEQGIYSYKRVLALTEHVFAEALAILASASAHSTAPGPAASALTQQHELIRDADENADLFAHAVTATSRTAAQGDRA